MAKNRIHSVLTALPPLMLMVGLFAYYRAEQAQFAGPPILAEQIIVAGEYKGTSELKSLGDSQLFFWLEGATRARGARITPGQLQALSSLEPALLVGQSLHVTLAPRVAGSTTYWVVTVKRNGESLL